MSDPRYRPRDFAADGGPYFGRVDEIRWRPLEGLSTTDRARSVAARMQHDWALRIRRAMRERNVTVKAYASRSDTPSYDRTVKMLRGDIIMRFEDVALAEVLLGGVFGPRVSG